MNDLRLLPDETIILKLRKHWMILVRDTIGTVLLSFLPFLLIAIVQILAPQYFLFSNYLSFMSFATTLWLLIIWMALAVIWTDYYLDLWIVTTSRVISIDQVSLFNRSVTSLSLDRIQEVTVKEENVVQALFKYGTLEIETASPTDGDSRMEGIPHPEHVRSVLMEHGRKR